MAYEKFPTEPKRIKAFADFFKNYMGISSFVVAALPIPVTALDGIPVFSDFRVPLSIYAPLFCFLTLSFIFYLRHWIAVHMFPVHQASLDVKLDYGWVSFLRVLPVWLVFLSFFSIVVYNFFLDWAVHDVAADLAKPKGEGVCSEIFKYRGFDEMKRVCTFPSRSEILAMAHMDVPFSFMLRTSYIGIFVFAEAAFVMMAAREYIQELLSLTDKQIILAGRNG